MNLRTSLALKLFYSVPQADAPCVRIVGRRHSHEAPRLAVEHAATRARVNELEDRLAALELRAAQGAYGRFVTWLAVKIQGPAGPLHT